MGKKIRVTRPNPEFASILSIQKGMDAASKSAPRYTMRPKVKFGAANVKPVTDAIYGSEIDKGTHTPIKWTMRMRTCKMLQLPGMTMDSVPGPGAYKDYTSLQSHPLLKQKGLGSKFGQSKASREVKDNGHPGPGAYSISKNVGLRDAPHYSMIARNAKVQKAAGGGAMYNIDNLYSNGPRSKGAYTIGARTCKLLQLPGQTTDTVPGPGAYQIKKEGAFLRGNGNHRDRNHRGGCSFGTASRFGDDHYDDDTMVILQ